MEVATAGADLTEGKALLFSNAKIVGKAIEGQANKFKVTIAPDVAPGVYDAWFVGKYGVSTSRAFVVGSRKESSESGAHASLTTAAAIEPGTIVNGRAEAGSADYFKFKAAKGQRILVECESNRIDSRMEASLVLFDMDAAELGRSRNRGMIDFEAPADGEYVVKVHDFQFRGGADYFYRLTIHSEPHVEFVLPASARSGGKTKHVAYGCNLPAGKVAGIEAAGRQLESLEIEVESPAGSDGLNGARLPGGGQPSAGGMAVKVGRFKAENGAVISVSLGDATTPTTLEKEPNDAPGEAQKIAVPTEISGQFYRQRDQDWFEFEAKKGDSFWIEVVSERLGLPTHPFALVQRIVKDDGGVEKASDLKELYETTTNLGGRRFNTYSRDFAWRLDVKEGGTHRIMVRDLYNEAGEQPERIYRLAVRKAAPDFQLVAMTEEPLPIKANTRPVYQWPTHIRKGGSIPLRVMAFRRDGFNDTIQLSVEGMPKGVTAHKAEIPAGQTTGWLTLSAAKDAADWGGVIKINGSAKVGDATVKRVARGAGINWAVGDYRTATAVSRMTSAIALGVAGSETAAIAMTAGDGKPLETTVGGKVELPVKVARNAGFAADLKVKVLGHGAFAKFKDATIKGGEGKVAIDLKTYKLPAGEHSLFLRTQSKGKWNKKDVTGTFYSTPFRIKVNPAPKK